MATLILAGCGGSSAPKVTTTAAWQTVEGRGVRFQAPAGWKVEHAPGRVSATEGAQLVEVSTFALQKPYRPELFARVASELQARMRQIAGQTGGTLGAERTVTADGIRSHAYEVRKADRVDEYTFVLSGKREYLLLCRRSSADTAGVCAQLVASFARRSG